MSVNSFTAKVLDAVAATADRTSEVIQIDRCVLGSLHIITTGTPVATAFILKFSNAPGGASMATTTDTTVLTALAAAVAAIGNGTPGSYVVENIALSAAFMQFVYDHSSSTGTITVYLAAKN